MGRHGRLDAFAEAELIIRIIQPDRTAADRVHRRQDLFSGSNVSVVDPLSALQTSIWPKNGNDQGRKPPDQGVIFIAVIGAPSMAADDPIHGRAVRLIAYPPHPLPPLQMARYRQCAAIGSLAATFRPAAVWSSPRLGT